MIFCSIVFMYHNENDATKCHIDQFCSQISNGSSINLPGPLYNNSKGLGEHCKLPQMHFCTLQARKSHLAVMILITYMQCFLILADGKRFTQTHPTLLVTCTNG